MTLSTPSSARLALASTSHVPSSSIWSPARKMLPTTTPVVTTPSVRKSSTLSSTASASSPTTALASKVSSSTTQLVVVPVPVLVLFFWSVFLSTTARNPSWPSPSPLHHRSPPLLSSHTTTSWPCTHFWSTLTCPSALTTKQSTTSA